MTLGRVIGSVWATRKDEGLNGTKILIIQPVDLNYDVDEEANPVIAVDSVGAGAGEIVLIAQGSSARQTKLTHNKPIDAVVMAIVDKLDVFGEAAG
ncbi:MAG: ethanolamine utilization protein EutN [Ectothiorhodospiraceae bacterium]|nr:ethanolamine utilization protein EutN [Ectothiorhodospiraceae bacterium]